MYVDICEWTKWLVSSYKPSWANDRTTVVRATKQSGPFALGYVTLRYEIGRAHV